MFKFLDTVYTKISKHESRKTDLTSVLYSSKTRAMAEDPAARVEQLEKAHLDLQEKHAKSCDEIS